MAEVTQDAPQDSKAFIDTEKESGVKSVVENGAAKIAADSDPKDKEAEEEEPEWMSTTMAEVTQDAPQDSKAFIDTERESGGKSVVENDAAKAAADSDPKDEEAEEEEPEWMDILGSGQIKKKVLNKGTEDSRPQQRDICEISYEGRLSDGTLVEKAERIKIHVGDGEVIQGIDLALTLMNEGEKCLLEVGPRFAYGTIGRPATSNYPAISENQNLSYTIELFSVNPEPEMGDISIAERKTIGSRKRERGNWWYGRKENTLAIHCYRRALEYLDEAEGGIQYNPSDKDENEEEALKELLEERLKVLNNMAAAQMKIGALDAGLTSLNNVLRCQPDNVKAIYRKAKILSEKGEVTAAIEALQKAVALEPDNKVVKAELQVLKKKAVNASIQEKNLYRKMMGGSGSQTKTGPEADRDGSNRNKFLPWGMVFGSVAVVLAGMVAYRFQLQ